MRHPRHRYPESHQMCAEFQRSRRLRVPPANHALVLSLADPVLATLFSIHDLVGGLTHGKGNLLGVFFGALSYTTINFIIVSIPALTTDIQDTFQGLVLIAVILIQTVGPVIKERFIEARKRRMSRRQTRQELADSKG